MSPTLSPFRAALRRAAPTLALGFAGLTVACADGPTAPGAAPAASRPVLAAAAPTDPRFASVGVGLTTDTLRGTFTIRPGVATRVWLGPAVRIDLAANGTCDPAQSSYGPGTWNDACARLSAPLTVAVKAFRGPDGAPRMQFSPDLRFAPGTFNTVALATRALAIPKDFRMDWCPSDGSACVNETLFDWSLVTYYDQTSGVLVRRIKHFSGYTVVANRARQGTAE